MSPDSPAISVAPHAPVPVRDIGDVAVRYVRSPAALLSPENRQRAKGASASLIVHLAGVIALGLLIHLPSQTASGPTDLVVTLSENVALTGGDATALDAGTPGGDTPSVDMGVPLTIETTNRVAIAWQGDVPRRQRSPAAAGPLVPNADWMSPSGAAVGGGIEGRGAGNKGGLLRERGGNQRSEDAVARGLRWLAVHQRRDGSWRFNHQEGPCGGHCRHPGDFSSKTAATALALLPFYGAGFTHRDGEYQDVMRQGLFYLANQMLVTPHGGDFQDGSMYGQGLTAIVLCEAYAMTKDEQLRPFAQAALQFIEHAQHVEGGWRYMPGQPGDTTVTGWQLMALKSGKMAGLKVDPDVQYRVTNFLHSVAAKSGSQYGYQNRESKQATTAVGLFCRMMTEWHRFHPALADGVKYLDELGPSQDDMYYNYYATQVLHHFDGPSWPRWNQKMRDRLIQEQARRGHESGSWFYEHQHSVAGGRLYNTCMAIMTLEVYYRYMPLYGTQAVND